MPADDVIVPDDYWDLLAVYGPGTLCGVLRLLAPGGPDGFSLEAAQRSLLTLGIERGYWEADNWNGEGLEDDTAIKGARLWGVFTTGETCWWLPIRDDPADWLVLIVGRGWQQLNVSTTDFLLRWAGGQLDLPALSHGAVRRDWQVTPADQPITTADLPGAARDPLAQLATIIGPGNVEPASFDWAPAETELGRPLPLDYKRLNEIYRASPSDQIFHRNGIYTATPEEFHDGNHCNVRDDLTSICLPPGFPSPRELLFFGSTEGRDLLAWDTRDPDPDRWPVISVNIAYAEAFPGTLTELYVAELTGTGLGLTSFTPGDPDKWAWTIWGPDAPRGKIAPPPRAS
jgi:hypothetical protein